MEFNSKKSGLKTKENRVFARLIGCELNKLETHNVSGGDGNSDDYIILPPIQYTYYETYIGSGMYMPDYTLV